MSSVELTERAASLPRHPLERRTSRRPPLLIAACAGVLTVMVLCAAVGSLIAPHSASALDLAHTYAGPSWKHLFGTDALGHDVFSRAIVGARLALIGPLVITAGEMVIGNTIGLISGYFGGLVDSILMRLCDMMFAIPGLLVVIVVSGVVGGGYWFSVLLLMLLNAPGDARVIRASILEQRARPYVEAARVLGVRRWRIMVHHVWPNALSVVVAMIFLDFAANLPALAGLSFLGLGSAPGAADWGRLITDNRTLIFQNPLASLGPAGALVITAVSVNLIGDWLYENIASKGRNR